MGQAVQLQIESVAQPETAEISRISPAVDLASRSLLFEAVLDNSDSRLRSGLFAEARIVTDPKAMTIVIPASALVEFAGTEKVWKVVDGESREQQVLTGERRPNGIQIVQGLVAGDIILLNGSSGRSANVIPILRDDAPAEEASKVSASQQSDESAGTAQSAKTVLSDVQSAQLKSAAPAQQQ